MSGEQNLEERVVIFSSDFLRVKQTAEIIHGELKLKASIQYKEALRERGLGKWDMGPGSIVTEMWARDAADPTHKFNGVESVMEMVLRTSKLVEQLDREFEDRIIILVSHGDPCQCLHAVFIGIHPSEFRSLPDFKNCEIRELVESG